MRDVSPPLHMRRDGFHPAPELSALRNDEGVTRIRTVFGTDAWLVTGFEDVRTVLSHPELYSNALVPPLRPPGAPPPSKEETAAMRAGNLLGSDPPEHTRLRRMLTPRVHRPPHAHAASRGSQQIVDDASRRHGGRRPARRPGDATSRCPFPSLVICELLGVPYADRADFQRRHAAAGPVPPRRTRRPRRAMDGLRAYMARLVGDKSARPRRGPARHAGREHGDELSRRRDSPASASLLLLAGHETTANMLGLGTLALLQTPRPARRCCATSPDLVDAAVEELLRYLTHRALRATVRITTAEVRLGGQTLRPRRVRHRARCPPPTATRRSSPTRTTSTSAGDAIGHVAFGHGIHHCLGAPAGPHGDAHRASRRCCAGSPACGWPASPCSAPSPSCIGLTTMPITW